MIALPNTIFSKILINSLDKAISRDFLITDVNKIPDMVESEFIDVGLVPLYSLIKHPDFYVSRSVGLTFDAGLSYSYIYYKMGENCLSKIYLYGDVTVNEIILSKILFQEKFDAIVDVSLTQNKPVIGAENYIICGDTNLKEEYLRKAFSFAEEICDLIKLPYTNFVFVSKQKSKIENLNKILEKIDYLVDDYLDSFTENLTNDPFLQDFIRDNQTGLFYTMTEAEEAGINELLKLPYYHGVVDDIVEVKFVG